MKWTDIFHCNNVEAAGVTGEKGVEESMAALINEGAKLVIENEGL